MNNNPKGKNQHAPRKWQWKGMEWTTRELANSCGISPEAMHKRLVIMGWPIDKAVSKALQHRPEKVVIYAEPIDRNRIEGMRMSFDL